jgi:hypothetical protein
MKNAKKKIWKNTKTILIQGLERGKKIQCKSVSELDLAITQALNYRLF